jgi:hypothetical protein
LRRKDTEGCRHVAPLQKCCFAPTLLAVGKACEEAAMKDDRDFLAQVTLSATEWKAIKEIEYKTSIDPVEFANLTVLSTVVSYLVDQGLVEVCNPLSGTKGIVSGTSYRLTDRGRRVYNRGQRPV